MHIVNGGNENFRTTANVFRKLRNKEIRSKIPPVERPTSQKIFSEFQVNECFSRDIELLKNHNAIRVTTLRFSLEAQIKLKKSARDTESLLVLVACHEWCFFDLPHDLCSHRTVEEVLEKSDPIYFFALITLINNNMSICFKRLYRRIMLQLDMMISKKTLISYRY
jgi:hypothetical protein